MFDLSPSCLCPVCMKDDMGREPDKGNTPRVLKKKKKLA